MFIGWMNEYAEASPPSLNEFGAKIQKRPMNTFTGLPKIYQLNNEACF